MNVPVATAHPGGLSSERLMRRVRGLASLEELGRMRRLLFAMTLLVTAGCGRRPAPGADGGATGGAATGATGSGAPEISRATFAPSLSVDLPAMRQTPRGVYIRDLTAGTGTEAVSGSQVAIHYVGKLTDGKQ